MLEMYIKVLPGAIVKGRTCLYHVIKIELYPQGNIIRIQVCNLMKDSKTFPFIQ